jgi:hypothetical protein
MIFKYGTYAHQQNSVALRITAISTFDRFRRRMGSTQRWDLVGVVRGTDDYDLTTKLAELEDAYDADYKDWTLFHDNGTTPTVHTVASANTFGGTKVLSGVNYLNGPWSGRPEYANQRTFTVSLGMETRVGDGYFSWKERLTIRGTGGPRWRFSPSIDAVPLAQQLQLYTSFHLIQEGTLVAREDWYAPASPVEPSWEHQELREVTYETADDIVVGGQEMFRTSWRYVMELNGYSGFSSLSVPSIT